MDVRFVCIPSWKENNRMSWGCLAIPTFPVFEGNGLKTSHCGHLVQLKERASTLVLGWTGDMLRYAMLGSPRTAIQVTSASLCGSSVFQILRDWHCESLKCHLLFMESQETLKAWTLSTNRSGVVFCIWGGYKQKAIHALQSRPTATTICMMWMAALWD